MKIKKLYILFFFFAISFNQIIFAKIENKIIVKIENEIITTYDVKNKILTTLLLANKEINQKNINNLKEQSLENLIQSKLKKIESIQYNIKKDDSRINSYLNSISSNNIQGLKEKFQKNNLDFQMFLDEIEYEFKWRKLIFQKYSNKIEIDPRNIEVEINNIIKNQNDVIELNLSEIEIVLNNDETDQVRIDQIKNEIKSYGFENTVVKYSISSSASNEGKIGWVNSSALSDQVLKAVNKLQTGDISQAVKRQDSILFLKLNEKKVFKSNEINKEKLKVDLIDQKKNELFNLFARSYLSKLRNMKLIEYF